MVNLCVSDVVGIVLEGQMTTANRVNADANDIRPIRTRLNHTYVRL
jgi:hypothetical protein